MMMFEVPGKIAGQPGPLLVCHAFTDPRGDVPNGFRWSGHCASVSTDREFFHGFTNEIRGSQPICPGEFLDPKLEGFVDGNGASGRKEGSHARIIRRNKSCDKAQTPVGLDA